MSHFSSVDSSPDPSTLIASLDRSALGLGAMKRYMAARLALLLGGSGRVLDVGCGAGHDLALLGAHDLEPIGLDASEVMLQESRRRGAVRLVRGDGGRLPFGDGTVDGCRMERVLLHVDDPRAMVGEVARVLRPGGVVAIFEPDWSTLAFISATAAAAGVPASLFSCRWPAIGGRLAGLVRRAGLEVVDEVTETSHSGRFSHLPLNVEALLQRAVQDGRVDAQAAAAWLDEQRERDAAGTFRARWVKRLVVAWKRA